MGSDRRVHRPLEMYQGWILPAGVEGVCEFDSDHSFLSVEVPSQMLVEAGMTKPDAIAPHVGAHDPLLLQMAQSVAEIGDTHPALYRDTMHRALAAHLAQVAAPVAIEEAFIEDARLRRAVAYLRDNLATDLSLDDLADQAAMSPFHFARAFKGATGRSPLQYVIHERLEAAKVLLTTTRLPIAEIAHRVGYEDVSRFGQHFKRATGITPAAFRTR